MTYGILLEKIEEPGFPAGYFYAHIPALGITTQGLGIDGARQAAADLVRLWIAEKRSHGETVPQPTSSYYSTLEISEDALQSA